ncbi:MAG TPA: primosomal protein N' [Ktedonobacteraceae bacterium]|nr:primosomal protein N' [Ktedonobacteraceae bacterium]
MYAGVLTTAASWHSEQPLLTYIVPPELQEIALPGQLVAAPFGNRLVEGIIWQLSKDADMSSFDGAMRPISTILDPEPALLPHQRALAEWLAEYYVTPLAHCAMIMLPPGLMQRSKVVLHLISPENSAPATAQQDAEFTRLQALIGLLLADGELDVERLKEMLGAKRAKEVVQEALASGIIVREAMLHEPRTRIRRKRIVRIIAPDDVLQQWKQRAEQIWRESLPEPGTIPMAPDNVRRRPNKPSLDPWAIPALSNASAALTLTSENKEGLLAQKQLLAIDLLEHEHEHTHWTPTMLCKASGLTQGQLQKLVREQLITIEEAEVQRDPLAERFIPDTQPLALTPDQQAAIERITGTYDAPPILLHGVTGSGKTEIYLQALDTILARGQRGIVLVPEIALTAQAIYRFAGRFPGRVAIIHSALSEGERYDEWRRIRSGKVDVVIGSRSALFSPVSNLGIIILDEEHEPAYKQDERRPKYHARETAITLGKMLGIPVVLGSATPSVESFYRAERGEYQLVELRSRVGGALPPVEIIDLRSELQAGNTSIISRRLQSELEQVLSKKQQAILYLNRRGAASCVLCRECGYVAMCDRCDVPLTYHSTERILLCHYCNRQSKILRICPQCGSEGIRYFGLGTEKVMATIGQMFPAARLLRWDRDTAKNRLAHEQLLDRFANREADILVGTQMIAKGLDLPGVTLVGVISADIALMLPDFSASERAFTLLTQVAGRAGRGEDPGQVIIQTFNPQHFCIDAASRHDYHEFYSAEIEARRRYGYPPFRQFVKFTFSHANRRRAQNEALLLREKLDEWINRLGLTHTDIVGPAPALMERLNNLYRWQMIARGPDLHPLLSVLDTSGWEVDIDPVSTL